MMINECMAITAFRLMASDLTDLPYTVHDFSSFSCDFSPKHILVDKPSDQKSRWLSDGNKPPQYVSLKLMKPAIACKIYFGKFERSHPCNIKKLKVYGGLDAEHTHLLLEGGLNNDGVSEMLDLQFCINDRPFPVQYIKIVPLQSWGGGFNFSIWHVQLWGIAEGVKVEDALTNLVQYREREAVRLCLKHLRQYDYCEAFEALQKKSKILLEDPILTRLYNELVTVGNFEAAECTMCKAMEEGFFDCHIARQSIRAKWTSLPCPVEPSLQTSNALALTPDMRGGHQMCMDTDAGQLYLYGGWDGNRELGDLWRFTIVSQQWDCLSRDTSQEGGPGPRSCHAMCFNSLKKVLYILGGYVEAPATDHHDSPPCGLYMCSVVTNKWDLLNEEGGPSMIYDHQMCYDSGSELLYVLGGRMAFTDLCSGLYALHTVNKSWICLSADQSRDPSSKTILPRNGHVMLFHPRLHQLFVLGGKRQQEILSDMLTYDVRSGEISILADGRDHTIPVTGLTLRAALDLSMDQICLTGLSKLELKGSNSLWLYDISTTQWSKVMRDEIIQQYDHPMPRYAHSFVCDSIYSCYYMFGGNPSNGLAKSNSSMRLDDFWQMQLMRQSQENFLKECQLSIRKQRYIELSFSSPVDAVVYLQTSIASIVDHTDNTESRQGSGLAELNHVRLLPGGTVVTFVVCDVIFQYRELTSVLFSSATVKSSNKDYSTDLQKKRMELYDNLASCFPHSMSQPKGNLIDFIII